MTAFGAACPHCDTLFKVFPDQLRLHNGFANCGSCGRTFDVQSVLIALPTHTTSFLERNTPFVDGLPVLNAVLHVTPSPLERIPPTPPSPVASVSSVPFAQTNHASPAPSVSIPTQVAPISNPIKINNVPTALTDSISTANSKHKHPILLFNDTDETTKVEPLVRDQALSWPVSKWLKWMLYLILILVCLVILSAVMQPEETRALAHQLVNQIIEWLPQSQPLLERVGTMLKSILTAMGIHG